MGLAVSNGMEYSSNKMIQRVDDHGLGTMHRLSFYDVWTVLGLAVGSRFGVDLSMIA